MSEVLATRIYDLKIQGYEDAAKKVQALTVAFQKMDTTKRKLNEQLQKRIDTGDTSAIQALTSRIKDLERQMDSVSKKRETAAKEALLLAQAEKELAKAEDVRLQSQIKQDKELDRQISLEEKQRKQLEKEKQALDALPGSYAAIRNSLNQLRPLLQNANKGSVISFEGSNLTFDQAIAKFKELSAAEQDFRRQFQKDGTLVGEYSSGIINAFNKLGLGDIINKNKGDIEGQLRRLRTESQQMATDLQRAGNLGSEGFHKIETQLRENIQLQEQLEGQLKTINSTLANTGSVGSKITGAISSGFKDARSHVNNLLVSYLGFQAALNAGQNIVHQNYELSDSMGQLQIYLKGSKTDADSLLESLKKIDTRTSLANIVDISTIVAKKGVAKDEITGVTKALDQLFVVLGTEVGDPHEAVSSLVKLVNVYSEDKHVTAKNIGDIGAAIQKLTSSGVATGSFLINFAERLAGVRGITGVSIQNVLGLGAAIQELGQTSEVAGSAASQLIVKLFADIPKYAGFAGKSVEEFTKTVTQNPVEALIQLAQGLKTNKEGLAEVAQAFDAAGIHGSRVVGVLGDIAGNADYMRKRVADSNKAFGDQATIVQAAAIKQNTFAATIDKVRKQFELIGTDRKFQNFLLSAASAVAFLAGHLQLAIPLVLTIIGLTNSWAGTLVRLTAAYALQITAWILEKAQLVATNALRAIAVTTMNVYTAATIRSAAATGAAAVAYRILAAAIALVTSPLGIAVGLLVAVTTIVGAFTASAKAASKEVSVFAEKMRIKNEIHAEAVKNISAEKAETSRLVATVNDLSLSLGRRQAAMDELNKKAPEYFDKLTIEQGKYVNLTKAVGDYNAALLLNAELEVSKARNTKALEEFNKLVTVKDDLELFQKGTLPVDKLSDEAKKAIGNEVRTDGGLFTFTASAPDFSKKGLQEAAARASNKLAAELSKQEVFVNTTEQIFKEAQQKVDQVLGRAAKNAGTPAGDTTTKSVPIANQSLADLKASLTTINSQIAGLDKIKNLTVDQKRQLETLRKDRSEIASKIRELGGTTTISHPKGSAIDVSDKEGFKDIDSVRDEQLARLKQSLLQHTEYQRKEEEVIKIGEDGKARVVKESATFQIKDEETFLRESLRINQIAIDEKLKLLKGSNAEERKTISELKLERVTQEQEVNAKIFESRKTSLKNQLDEEIKIIQQKNQLIEEDPTVSTTEKVSKKKESDEQILALTERYGNEIAVLEKQFGQQSIQTTKEVADAVRAIKEDLRKDEKELLQANLKDAEDAGNQSIASFKKNIEAQRLAILESNKPQKKKDKALGELKDQEDFGVLAREVNKNNIEKEIYEKLLKAKVITQEEYDKFLTESYKKEQELHDAGVKSTEKSVENITTVGQLITSKLSSIFKFDDGSASGIAKEKLLADTLAQSYQFAQNAMNSYFDSEKARIEKSKELIYKRIDLDKEQLLNQATTQTEKDRIERQAAAQKEKADKDAFEKGKKIQLAQAKMNLGIQLSNLAVIAFAPNPANIATLGVAGAIMYAIQAGLAVSNYFLNVKRIQESQFAGGGRAKSPVTTLINNVKNFVDGGGVSPRAAGNGKITFMPNIPAQPNGDNVFATVKTGEVILNDKQQKALGGDETFKRIGVPGFASGGTVDKDKMFSYSTGGSVGFPGSLGENLTPPANASGFLNGSSSGTLTEVKELLAQQTVNLSETARQIHQRIDKIKVVNDPVEASSVNDQFKKAQQIGRIA
jgi:hypothetical protein